LSVMIVTDSTCDLPEELVEELGISVVPQYVRFGELVYRDGVDISKDEFYQRLGSGPPYPTTSQPSPQDFFKVFQAKIGGADGILCIVESSKLSGTYQSALVAAKQIMPAGSAIEVVDSLSVSLGLGLLVIEAARLARTGLSLPEITARIEAMRSQIRLRGFFDTLKYLALGGRIGKGKALLGSVLDVKPLLTLKDGEILPVGQVRSRTKAIEKLIEYVSQAEEISDLCLVYSTTPNDAQGLADRLGAFFPRERMIISQMGSTVGAHAGPGILFVGFI
jgi:DegV family protein with EDD domain